MFFTRIGNRFVYTLKLDSKEEATELISKTGLFTIPDKKLAIFGDKVTNSQFKFTATKDDEIGYNINISHLSRKIDMQIPKCIKYDASAYTLEGLLIDIDYHPLKPFDVGNFRGNDLVKKNKKDMEYIIKGLWA
jgi:hypothetical protein